MSYFQRFTADATHAFEDLYSNLVLGDDAGKSAKITLYLEPRQLPVVSRKARIDLGMTFLEVNGRAYVQSVAPGSAAAQAGVQPQDAVQYAMVSWLDDKERARQNVLDLEAKGMRIQYNELRNLLAEAMDPTQSAFLSPSTSTATWSGPPIPSNICVPMTMDMDSDGNTPFSGQQPRPVVFCFRRTRQRRTLGPALRLDDECDAAVSLVKRLAPTRDMAAPTPDAWDELVHDGTDWLLGSGSMLPPKQSLVTSAIAEDSEEIPMDDMEKERAHKLAQLRSRMAASQLDRTNDVEASTIRGMIQKAVGLAFVRASKVVMGVSVHGGSGIVLARLSDGTWSAPSAIGTWGLGLGLQFGLEVAEYIFILQTQEAVDHFRRGGSFTVGGNIGAAVAGLGREAYGAASVGGGCGNVNQVKDDVYNDDESADETPANSSVGIAPIVAYAKSQGLYIGVSLEGSRIFVRNDINRRTYKFATGRNVSADDILSGRVPTPPEAEELYAALHSVEFTHEMSCLPRPPEVLRVDSANAWHFGRSTLGKNPETPFKFLSSLTKEESMECESFETQFKKFLYGGVSVQRLIPDTETRSGRTRRERRTLWLMLPESGSLMLGFVSKLSDGETAVSNKNSTMRARREDSRGRSSSVTDNDVHTIGSEEVTLDSAINTKDGGSTVATNIRTGNVQLSTKHSVALTDVTVLSQETPVPIKFKSDDQMEHLRVIAIQDVSGASLLFLANNFREAELLVCGLKLLLERETLRLGVRGGLPMSALGERSVEGAMSPLAARGYRETSNIRKKKASRSNRSVSSTTSETIMDDHTESTGWVDPSLPEGRHSWGNVPGRQYMRVQAAAVSGDETGQVDEHGVPKYKFGQQIAKTIVKDVRLRLPLPLCRVLLLDSTSPVMRQWEKDRGDQRFDRSRWSFPPATPRESETHGTEHQLIASGSMCGASRTTSFDRPRYGKMVRLSEIHTVDADDSKKVSLTVTDRHPRRGFSVQVRVDLRARKENACDATVTADVRPIGKDMSNQAAVHKAFLLVVDELTGRYGTEGGLLAGFQRVLDTMAEEQASSGNKIPGPFSRTLPGFEEKKVDDSSVASSKRSAKKESGLVSLADMIPTGRVSPELVPITIERPSTPSVHHELPAPPEKSPLPPTDEPVLIKPLPKIRLSLLPSPREEDEDLSSSASPIPSKPISKKKKKSRSRA